MRFAFSEQQAEFRDAVRAVLAKECTTDHLRAAYNAPGVRGRRWDALVELGVVGLTVPERHGGLGLGFVDLVPLLEEAGRAGVPEPLLETTALAAPLLADLDGSAPVTSDRLEAIAAGRVAAAVAPAGRSGPVPKATGADLLVLVAPDRRPAELHLLDAVAVAVTPVASLDPTRCLGVPVWEPSASTLLASGGDAERAIRTTADRAAVATGAELLGLADRLVDLAASYAKDRKQFGVPIGSFQAVKHLLAGAAVALEFARPLVYGAAWSLDSADPAASRAASAAKAAASDAASRAASAALQVHGAIGYTWECDVHLFLKRAWALAEAWGSAAEHRAAVLDSLLDERRAGGD